MTVELDSIMGLTDKHVFRSNMTNLIGLSLEKFTQYGQTDPSVFVHKEDFKTQTILLICIQFRVFYSASVSGQKRMSVER